jgi:uncharacterized protein with ATP-grasp and redox domains
MSGYYHRETKGYLYSDRNIAADYISSAVAGITGVEEPYKLAHKSSRKERQKMRNKFRKERNCTVDSNQSVKKRTVVAFGDASIMGSMKGHSPVPVKVNSPHLYCTETISIALS